MRDSPPPPDDNRPAAVDVCHLMVTDTIDSPRALHKEARAAVRAGWSVALVGIGADRSWWEGVRRIGIPRPSSRLRLVSAAQGLFRVRALRPRLVHAHDLQTLLAARALKAVIGCRLVYDAPEDYPVVYPKNLGLRGRPARVASWMTTTLERLLTRGADAVLTVDELIAEHFVPWGRPIQVVRNLTPIEFASGGDPRPELAALAGRPVFVYLGEVGPQVAGFEILDACARIREGHPELAGLFLGGFSDEDYARAFKARVEQLDLTGSILTVPGVPYRQVFSYLTRSSVGMLLYARSMNYGDRVQWPHKLCDYLAAGLPMLASDLTGLRSVLEPLGIAHFADPSDPDSIAEAMQRFLNSPQETAAMADRCRCAYERELNWESEQARLLGVYERLLGPVSSEVLAPGRRPTA